MRSMQHLKSALGTHHLASISADDIEAYLRPVGCSNG